jgi:hypothetical protein
MGQPVGVGDHLFCQSADHLGQGLAGSRERLVEEPRELRGRTGHRPRLRGIAASLEVVGRNRMKSAGRVRQRVGFQVAQDVGEGHEFNSI